LKEFYKVEPNCNKIYCPETNEFTVLEEDEDGIILVTNSKVELNQTDDGDACILFV
jgi:hypothetical protein